MPKLGFGLASYPGRVGGEKRPGYEARFGYVLMGIRGVHGAPPLLSCAIHDVQRFSLAYRKLKLLIQHNQLSPDPFPLLRVGSGDETRLSPDPFPILWVGSGYETTK